MKRRRTSMYPNKLLAVPEFVPIIMRHMSIHHSSFRSSCLVLSSIRRDLRSLPPASENRGRRAHKIVHFSLRFLLRYLLAAGSSAREGCASSRSSSCLSSRRSICRQRSMKTSSTLAKGGGTHPFVSLTHMSGWWPIRPKANKTPTSCPGTGLVVGRVPALRQREGLGAIHRPLILQIGLVADNYHRDLLIILDAYDVVTEHLKLLKRRLGRNAEHQEESMPCFHVEIPHGNLRRASANTIKGAQTADTTNQIVLCQQCRD